MKFILIALIGMLSCSHVNSKSEQKVWIPEKYVHGILNNDNNIEKFIYPISSITDPFGNCSIIAYKSEIREVATKHITVGREVKVQVLNVTYNFNLVEISKETVEKYEDAKVLLSMQGEKLLLEIVHSSNIDSIYLISHVGNYNFTDFYNAVDYIKKQK